MQRRAFLAAIGLAAAPLPARAAPLDRVLRDLEHLGYDSFDISTTMLGRTRVFAAGPPGEREIILNRNTGEVLRDVWRPRDGDAAARSGRSARGAEDDDDGDGQGRGRGRGRGGDDSGDDGSGSSGSGSGGRGGDDSGGGGRGGDGGGGGRGGRDD